MRARALRCTLAAVCTHSCVHTHTPYCVHVLRAEWGSRPFADQPGNSTKKNLFGVVCRMWYGKKINHSKHLVTKSTSNIKHVSQAPPGRAKCPADPHARRRSKRQAVKGAKRPGREQGRRRAWGSRGHFGGRCCLTAGATTDHSPDAWRLRHPDR